jgi:hypothetical protein
LLTSHKPSHKRKRKRKNHDMENPNDVVILGSSDGVQHPRIRIKVRIKGLLIFEDVHYIFSLFSVLVQSHSATSRWIIVNDGCYSIFLRTIR